MRLHDVTPRYPRLGVVLGAFATALVVGACSSSGSAGAPSLRVGAIFPLSGGTAADAGDEYLGAAIAAEMVNDAGGVNGRQISLDTRDVVSTGQIPAAVASLRSDGVSVVIGAYSSQLSIPAAAAVARAGMVYWETGAVADQVTGQGSPLVFRVGANGADLGGNSGRFVLQQLIPRIGMPANALSAFLVTADDAYAHSVADAARAALAAGGMPVAGAAVYNPYAPEWSPVIAEIKATKPAILLLSSHIPDGVAFRRAFLAAGLHVDAFIGTTMAQCTDFGTALGADAVGVFASDRPEYGFNASALSGTAERLYLQFADAWRQKTGRDPTQEGISGFTAAWVLFDDALRGAAHFSAESIAAAARAIDLPTGSLPNGAGVLFSTALDQLGQNVRAAADIWQWQAPQRYVVVWPAAYATGGLEMGPQSASSPDAQPGSAASSW